MADIPIFSGSAGSLPSIAPDSGIDRLDVNAYLRGAQGAQYLPSATTSIARGIEGAVSAYQGYRQNEANIGRTEAQTAGLEQAQELAPYEAETARIQMESMQLRAQTEAQLMPLKAASEYQQAQTESLKAQTEASKFQLEQTTTQRRLTQQKNATDALTLAQGDNLDAGISAVEKALPDIIANGITTTKSGDPTPDPMTEDAINNLAARAIQSGDKNLIAKTDNIRRRFYQPVNTQSAARKGFEVGPPVQQQSPQGAPPPTAGGEMAGTGAQQAPQAGPQNAPYAQFNQPYAQQGQRQASGQDLGSIKRQIQSEPGGNRMTPAQIEDAALKRLANQQVAQRMQPFEFKDYEKLQTSAVQYGVMADKADSAMKRLDIITKKYLSDPEFGKANKAGAFWQGLTAAVKNNDEDAAIVQEVKAELNSLGGYQALLAVSADLGMGQQVINTEDERELIMGMFTGEQASVDRNKQAVALLRAKAGETRDLASLTNGLLQGGKRYQEAKIIANDYRLNNRSTTVKTRDTEYGYQMPYVDIETGRKSTSEYLSEIFGSNARQGRDPNGRAISAAPSTPDDIDRLLPDGNDTTLLKKQMEQTSGTDIPEFQPKGVSRETLLRTVAAESSGNPEAEGPDTSTGTAKGLVQLKDATGEKLWSLYKKDFGLTGEYDPKDAVQNISLAQYHMNELLPKYNGDTRQMLAAYHLGEPEFNKVLESAKKDKRTEQRGGVDWPILRDHLKDKGRSEVATYIADIMGDGKPAGPQLANNLTQGQVVDKLPTPQAREFAQANLTPRGMEMLSQVTGANKIEDVQGTFLGDYLSAMFAPLLGLVTPQDANAEEPEGDSPSGSPSPSPTPSPNPTPSPTPGSPDGGDAAPSSEPMPSPGGAPPSDGSPPATPSQALANLIPPAIQAAAIGATNAALMGGDDEAMAGLLVMMGEDYEPAVRRVRAIRDEFQQNYPNAFNRGWYAGIPMGMAATGVATKAVGAGIKGGQALTGVAPKAAPVAGEVARQTAGQIVKKGMIGGAGYGAASGFLQGEEGAGNRAESALQGGAVGGVLGAGLGGLIAGGRAAIQSGPVQRTIARISGNTAEAPAKMNRGGEALSERLEGETTPELQDIQKRLTVPGNETLLGDELQDIGNTGQFVDAASKVPKTSAPLRRLAETRSRERPGNVREYMKDQQVPGSKPKPLQKVAQEEVESQPERLRQIVGQFSKVADEGEESFTAASRTAQNKNIEIRAERQTKAGPVYDEAMDSLANPKTGIPEFNSKGIKFLIEEDAVISDAIDQASQKSGLKDLPRNSVRVVREARDILDSQAQSGAKQRAIGTRTQGGIRSHEAGQAADRLTDGMRSESPILAKADKLYREGSEDVRAFNTRMSRQLQKFARADTSDDVTKLGDYLFSRKPQQLREFKANFSPTEWADFQEATGAHLIKQFEAKDKFQNFSKDYGAENLEVIFGKTKAAQIVKQFGKEAERFDVVKGVAEAEDVGKHLMSMEPDQLKRTLRTFTPAQAEAAEKDIERYVMNEIGKAPERIPGTNTQAFPKFSKDFGREKFQIVFGKDRGNAIMKKFEQVEKTARTDSRITGMGSQTNPRGAEASVGERAGMVASAITKLSIRGKFGLSSAGRDLVEAVKTSKAMREQVQQAAEILLIDPKKGPEFLRKEIANRLAKEKLTVDNAAINQFIELATEQAAKAGKRVAGIGGSGAVANESSRYSEEYRSQRRQMQE